MTRICSVDGCGKIHYAKNYCRMHHARFIRNGDPLKITKVFGQQRSSHPLYETYLNMKARCLNKNSTSYKNYGGRGISICERWLGLYGFDNFVADMGERPEGMTLDRKDNDGNYEPSNCKWATGEEQNINKRQKNNQTGFPGVYRSKGKFAAAINIKGKYEYLGSYDTAQEASKIYLSRKSDILKFKHKEKI